MSLSTRTLPHYGTEHFGRLKAVMVHNPGPALKVIGLNNCRHFLFDRAPDIDRYMAEHEAYVQLLQSHGVEVFELADYVRDSADRMQHLPNLAYMHDIAVITRQGAILSKMQFGGRKGEEDVVREALNRIGIPVFHEFGEDDAFEGCLILPSNTLLVAETERHSPGSIEKLIPRALTLFDEIIYVDIPDERRFMHPDMVYGQINDHLALAYLEAFHRVTLITPQSRTRIDDFVRFMAERGIELFPVSGEEQRRWACSFVPLQSDAIVHYDSAWSERTKTELSERGVQLIPFHPQALLAGGGSLRCLTLQLWRD